MVEVSLVGCFDLDNRIVQQKSPPPVISLPLQPYTTFDYSSGNGNGNRNGNVNRNGRCAGLQATATVAARVTGRATPVRRNRI